MDPIERRELKRKAWARLAARRRRVAILRGRVVVMSLICFAVLWGVVFAQMATGNDPVLGGKEKTAATRTVASAKKSTKKEVEVEAEPEEGATEGEAEAEAAEAEAEVETETGEAEAETEPLVTSQS